MGLRKPEETGMVTNEGKNRKQRDGLQTSSLS